MRLRDSLLSAAEPDPPQPYSGPHSPLVEIVIPVRNEDRDLAPCIRRLRTYLCEELPFAARITIADNGSTDGTWAQALALAGELALVHAVGWSGPGVAARCARSGLPATPTCTRTWTWTCPPT
jgi:hypothetical protein